MRKVKFKKYIPATMIPATDGHGKMNKKGTGCESDYIHDGVFHEWGTEYEEFEDGASQYSVAIVELPDGTIETIHPEYIKFLEPTK